MNEVNEKKVSPKVLIPSLVLSVVLFILSFVVAPENADPSGDDSGSDITGTIYLNSEKSIYGNGYEDFEYTFTPSSTGYYYLSTSYVSLHKAKNASNGSTIDYDIESQTKSGYSSTYKIYLYSGYEYKICGELNSSSNNGKLFISNSNVIADTIYLNTTKYTNGSYGYEFDYTFTPTYTGYYYLSTNNVSIDDITDNYNSHPSYSETSNTRSGYDATYEIYLNSSRTYTISVQQTASYDAKLYIELAN